MDRIDAHAVVPHLVMQVGCDRKSRVARKSDDVAATDLLPAADIDRQQVTVRGFVTVAVIDDDGAARRRARGDLLHAAVRRGEDARTFGHRVIDALMGLQGAVEGVDAHAVGGGEQRELLVDNGLYGRNPVAAVAEGAVAPLTITATHAGEEGGASLASANRVVGVGRGLTGKDQLALAEALAEALGAEIACSLSLCDDYRWFEHGRVVGTSTQRIAPRLYVSVGISGQPQHMTGVRGAKTIVAINNDPEAPIFRACAYGIVGDLNKVVPALTEALS